VYKVAGYNIVDKIFMADERKNDWENVLAQGKSNS
jgi:hypothetical protein